MFYELQRAVEGKAKTYLIPHGGGTVHDPEVICRKIIEAAKERPAKEPQK
jgi:hypothetical protein